MIAAGGGVVVRPENRGLLRQNGPVVFLKRDLSRLATDGRPISMSRPLEQIYEERIEFYRDWSDIQAENTDVEQTVKEIAALLEY